MMNNFKTIIKYLIIFILVLIFNLICNPINLDEVWNYGFSNNIYQGLIPYKDFNMVLTPFYAIFMSIPFYLFHSNMLVFHITNALLVMCSFILLDKIYKDKMWIILLFLFFPVNFCFPNYNLFLFILLCFLIYMEKYYVNNNSKYINYLIGVVLGITILTKQTVGGCLVLVSLYYIKDFKIIIKRFIGLMVPIGVFLMYLIINQAFFNFVDLCVLGLIDFSSNNNGFNIYLVFFFLLLTYVVYKIYKNRSNILYYYVLAFFSIAIPLADTYHIGYVFLSFLLVLLDEFDKRIIHYEVFSIVSIICLGIMTFYNNSDGNFKNYPNDIRHFEYRFINKDSYNFTNEVNEFIIKNKDKKIIFLTANAYYFKIINDMPCDYLDLINYGNWGYNGSKKLLSKIRKEKKALFIVDKNELDISKQSDRKALSYVIKNGKKIGRIRIYDIYEF